MVSERIQRRINQLLDEADEALGRRDWAQVRDSAQAVLSLDPENADAQTYLAAAQRASSPAGEQPDSRTETGGKGGDVGQVQTAAVTTPSSFANGRYTVKRFLGEGGKKRVYLAHDTTLARDVAFALIKADGLDVEGRERITREAQAMGKLGTHPHVVSVFDMGSEGESPYLVTELMQGGDIEGLLEKAPEHRLAIPDAVSLAVQVCRGLEFAHSHGLVHRDLKPGNVWLTADGTAKIGDFGLAVSLDRSRLTRAGMMVGTVSYMPPEQAMGGEVSPRSDLYSLGAMLYEMVTGRPPFVGEESVAIITQHLNVPPVSPTWHRPDCPPGLEALILRLLEKDAAKRPGSAAEVRQALENLAVQGPTSNVQGPTSKVQGDGGGDPGAGTPDPVLRGDNPLYRRTFVGREQELRQLQATFDGAVSGNGALVMVVGEPGIGKTALCEQLATYVAIRGGKVLVGHSYEEGSLSIPYHPFVEALRGYVLDREPDTLRKELGSGAAEVARIVSEVQERIAVAPRPPGDPEDDRWRLYQALAALLRNASAVQPLMVILEDLHWADRGTLDLLVHLARSLQGSRLLVLGTYRDVEVDRAHPLSATLAELRRLRELPRVALRGLRAEEVQRMLSGLSGQQVSWGLANAVHRQTEGNPLFVQEVVRYLVEEGLITREEGRWRATGSGPLALSIPEGLRDVIGRRLSRLSPQCNQLLAIAAVIGRDFGLDTLQTVTSIPEEHVLDGIEDAVRVGVLEEQSRPGMIRYRFTHAFFRQTLYEELLAPRRLRLHQQVARALEEQYATRLEDHAAELAEHFAQSTDPRDLRKAVEYSRLAATRAIGVYAYSEAVRLLEQAHQVQEVLDPDDRVTRCDILLTLSEVLLGAGDAPRAAAETGPAAFELADGLHDAERGAKACVATLRAMSWVGGGAAQRSPEWRRWAERADGLARDGTRERARADLELARAWWAAGERPAAWDRALRGLRLARELGDDLSIWYGYTVTLAWIPIPQTEEARVEIAEEIIRHRDWPGASTVDINADLFLAGSVLLSRGEPERCQELWRQLVGLADRTRTPLGKIWFSITEIMEAVLAGNLEQAVQRGTSLVGEVAEWGSPTLGRRFGANSAFTPLLYLGRAEEPLAELSKPDTATGVEGDTADHAGQRALCLAHLGRLEEARQVLGPLLTSSDPGSEEDASPTWLLAAVLETAVLTGDRDLAERLVRRLAPLAERVPIGPNYLGTCIARHLGAACALLGDREGAAAYYQRAIDFCERIHHRPEAALARLQFAELLLETGPGPEAVDLLDVAISEFRLMKMQPALERALKHKGLLHA